ncbi:hypothetical protein Dimus_005380 [Dionaea muscipula]
MRSRKDCSSMLIFVKEFYAKMTVVHLKKKDVIKSSVKGIGIEFDHEQWPPYLVCLEEMECVNTSKKCGRNQNTQSHLRLQGDLQMMKHSQLPEELNTDHELPYGDWLTLIFEAFGVPLVIKKEKNLRNTISLKTPSSPCVSLPRENGIWWIGSGENRRRDDDGDAPEVEAKVKMKGTRMILIGSDD